MIGDGAKPALSSPVRVKVVPMSDDPKNPAAETPIERALRMKKAATQARPKPPGGGKAQRERAAGIAAGVSKPWMKR
jgi:hypothetical protein